MTSLAGCGRLRKHGSRELLVAADNGPSRRFQSLLELLFRGLFGHLVYLFADGANRKHIIHHQPLRNH